MTEYPARGESRYDRENPTGQEQDDPPIRLAHVLFVLWVAGSTAWALYAAALAHERAWWELEPALGAILVLAPVILAHALANFLIRITGNPRFRS
jgi:hypothetical protein